MPNHEKSEPVSSSTQPPTDTSTPSAQFQPETSHTRSVNPPRHSAFGALAKFLTPEGRAKLSTGPTTGETLAASTEDTADQPATNEIRERRRMPPRRKGAAKKHNQNRRERGTKQPMAPRIEQAVAVAERFGQEEAHFAQTLVQALVHEVDRFTTQLDTIAGLDVDLKSAVQTGVQRMLALAQEPLTKAVDGSAPLTIGVAGSAGVGKSTLIEALAKESGQEPARDAEGRLSTIWRGIRFVEMPTSQPVDGIIEVRMAGIEPVPTRRPLLVFENVRVNLHDGFAFEKFLKDPDSYLGPVARFEEEDTIAKVHLLAFNLAKRPEHKGRSPRLLEASRFTMVETELARRLQARAKVLRIHSFLDALIESIIPLRDFALTVNLQTHAEAKTLQSRLGEMIAATAAWGDNVRKSIREHVKQWLASLRNQLEAFANKHAGERDVPELWSKRLAGLDLPHQVATECAQIESEFKKHASRLADWLKTRRQAGEGPLPQPVIAANPVPALREVLAEFRTKLANVVNPLTWVAPLAPFAPNLEEVGDFPPDRDRLLANLTRRLDKLERRLVEEVETRFVAAILLPMERRFTAESRILLDALFHLGREAHSLMVVANEVLLSLTQRLIERCAEQQGIKLPLIQKIVRQPGHRTKLLVPPSKDLFPMARRLQEVLGERVDLVPAEEDPAACIAAALMPAKLKPAMVTVNEEKRAAQVRVPRRESGKAFGRNAANQRLAATLTGYHLHLRIAKDETAAMVPPAPESVISQENTPAEAEPLNSLAGTGSEDGETGVE